MFAKKTVYIYRGTRVETPLRKTTKQRSRLILRHDTPPLKTSDFFFNERFIAAAETTVGPMVRGVSLFGPFFALARSHSCEYPLRPSAVLRFLGVR